MKNVFMAIFIVLNWMATVLFTVVLIWFSVATIGWLYLETREYIALAWGQMWSWFKGLFKRSKAAHA